MPIEQYTAKKIQIKLFSHLHNLSLRWHLGRKTGEVLEVMNRGANSINGLMGYVLQTIAPAVFDIIVSVVFLSYMLNWYFGVIAIVAMFLYSRKQIRLTILCNHFILTIVWDVTGLTTVITDWENDARKRWNANYDEQISRSIDSLLNYETVKYYVAEQFEITNYVNRISIYQKDEFKSRMAYQLLDVVQTVIINISLLIGSLYCAYLVAYEGTLTPGQYVMFATYVFQIFYPFHSIGSFYK